MKSTFLLALVLFFNCSHFCRADKANSTIESLQRALKKNDRIAISKLFSYPIENHQAKSVAEAKNSSQFLKNYADYFDENIISQIQSKGVTDKENKIDKGGMVGFLNGLIWVNNASGRISSFHYRTKIFVAKVDDINKKVASKAHTELGKYKNIVLNCTTQSWLIYVFEVKDEQYRLGLWKKGKSISDKPDLVIDGERTIEGSAGNTDYRFKQGSITYTVDQSQACSDDNDRNNDGKCDLELYKEVDSEASDKEVEWCFI